MATLLAPYNTAMHLGQGFNSFTQSLCVDHAVIREGEADPLKSQPTDVRATEVAQEVVYKSAIVDKVTDVTSAMNINPAFAIKYDGFDAKGKGDFVNTYKVKESDITFMITVKVLNQVIYDNSLTKFNPISNLKSESNFADVYGDSFISGFQEGGTFSAVISIKARNRSKAEEIKASAAIAFTKNKPTTTDSPPIEGSGPSAAPAKPGLDLSLEGDFGKGLTDILEENETTISVTYTGGGQELKKSDEDWTFSTMRAAALKFPELVAKTPMRTHAILTKYSALRSFFAATQSLSKSLVPNFEKASVYATVLQEAYLDYKTIGKNLQVLSFDVSAGTFKLSESPATIAAAKSENGTPNDGSTTVQPAHGKPATHESDSDSLVEVKPQTTSTANSQQVSLRINAPYPPTLSGLESARGTVRKMLNRIVSEVDNITRDPNLALDESRALPYMSPFLFKELLPVGSAVQPASAALSLGNLGNTPSNATADAQAPPSSTDLKDPAAIDPAKMADMADGMGGKLRF